MAKPKKRRGGAEGTQKTSPPAPPGQRPWTAEEMEAARPLPIPETESEVATPPPSGVPHAGEGRVKPGGRPESE